MTTVRATSGASLGRAARRGSSRRQQPTAVARAATRRARLAVMMSRASLDKQPHEVAAMFDDVAERYDVTNDVLSLGQDRRWRRAVLSAVDAAARRTRARPRRRHRHEQRAVRARRARPPCRATSRSACSRSASGERPRLPFVAGDATRLPFADATFDAVTISFGLRNVRRLPRRARRDAARHASPAAGWSCASSASRPTRRSAPSTAST